MNRSTSLLISIAFSLMVFASQLATGSTISLDATIGPTGEHAENVDMWGDRFIVGGDDFESIIYKNNNGSWQQEARLTPWDGIGKIFGYSVAIASNVAVVSNPWVNSEDGAMYVFKYEAGVWLPDTILQPPSGTKNHWFGTQVAVDGDWIVSGAPRPYLWNRSVLGATYVYHRQEDTWQEYTVLNSPDEVLGDRFGSAVDVQGNRMIIGAQNENGTGAAYIYELQENTWQFQEKLTSPALSETGNFGALVAIDGETAIVGDPANGDAYVFDLDGMTWNHTLTVGPVSADGTNVHRTIDVDGDIIVIGDPNRGSGLNDALTSIYMRSDNGWLLYDRLSSPLPGDGTFGLSVNAENHSIIVTAYGDSGKAYVYSVGTPIPEPRTGLLLLGLLSLSSAFFCRQNTIARSSGTNL